jgi:hypothetical protein
MVLLCAPITQMPGAYVTKKTSFTNFAVVLRIAACVLCSESLAANRPFFRTKQLANVAKMAMLAAVRDYWRPDPT